MVVDKTMLMNSLDVCERFIPLWCKHLEIVQKTLTEVMSVSTRKQDVFNEAVYSL